jgi:hypothetical protein
MNNFVEPSWYSLSWSRNSPPFMDPKGFLPCSQKLATGPYPALDPVYMRTSYVFMIIFNIVRPFTSRSLKMPLPFGRFVCVAVIMISNSSAGVQTQDWSLPCPFKQQQLAAVIFLAWYSFFIGGGECCDLCRNCNTNIHLVSTLCLSVPPSYFRLSALCVHPFHYRVFQLLALFYGFLCWTFNPS